MILMIDNYDSFTYNLVQYLGEIGEDVKVVRNDQIGISEIKALQPDHIVISPGPCTPNEAGVSLETITEFSGEIPIFGVCLGASEYWSGLRWQNSKGTRSYAWQNFNGAPP